MKRTAIILSLIAFLSSCKSGDKKTIDATAKDTTIIASVTASGTEAADPDSASRMKNMQEYMTPGKEHQMMAAWNGTWNGEMTFWMSPSAPPVKATTSSINKMILGGRFQQSTMKTTINKMPFEGLSIMGFDNAKKVFTETWIDNMTTGTILLQGPWNETTKSMSLTGTEVDPATGKERFIRQMLRVIDNDRQVMEMYEPGPDGKEMKTMEVFYTRKK